MWHVLCGEKKRILINIHEKCRPKWIDLAELGRWPGWTREERERVRVDLATHTTKSFREYSVWYARCPAWCNTDNQPVNLFSEFIWIIDVTHAVSPYAGKKVNSDATNCELQKRWQKCNENGRKKVQTKLRMKIYFFENFRCNFFSRQFCASNRNGRVTTRPVPCPWVRRMEDRSSLMKNPTYRRQHTDRRRHYAFRFMLTQHWRVVLQCVIGLCMRIHKRTTINREIKLSSDEDEQKTMELSHSLFNMHK